MKKIEKCCIIFLWKGVTYVPENKPDVLELLKLTRTLIRQIKFFNKIELSSEEEEIVRKSLKKLRRKIDDYLEGY